MNVNGAVVVVTGATAGIGRGIAREFGRAGALVIGTGRDVSRGEAAQAELRAEGFDFMFVEADVREPEQCRAVIATTVEHHGRVDVLINNAGTVGSDPGRAFENVDEALYDEIFDSNVKGQFFMTQAAAAVMEDVGAGVVINVGSAAGEMQRSDIIAYRASKAGSMFMSDCLRVHLAPRGIRVHTAVIYRVATAGGLRWLQARIDDQPEREDEFRDEYLATSVEPEALGASFVKLVQYPSVIHGPGYVVRT